MAAEASGARVIALRCSACHGALPAASNDVAFRCPQCGRAWEIIGGVLRERPSAFVAPPPSPRHPILYLPYWSFPVSAKATPSGFQEESHLKARDRAAKFERAFVSAFSIYRPTYVGEWGLVYTRLPPKWQTRTGHGPRAPGATISGFDARKLAALYILGEIDRAADIGSLEIELDVGEPELWAIPCYDLGEGIRCPWSRAELPVGALDDVAEIRRVTQRLEA
ncbi:MAG: hypothetical protein GWN99_07550 [Gemmatimonadetes bacterium]|uniref:Uncharacterized protein n=1 Tax=Candidatus Kutchimonas denitrificans TaxID=3056748 RepID=A0AAE4Z7K0_9BACT|nr:hypothetical protein [Gemmatimonadota bacterium]NIR75083.1 hypothetical protein [Candidatus Kutchimonas denitrificans]NIS00915.1 hypothetical protein [Gemmatimonadota bacterium]NIT66532.1 hypothetical protein [Gemmatimonadota bacterium]NIU52878.1 hypothetical protein [Gemmatimonadota bacterium]